MLDLERFPFFARIIERLRPFFHSYAYIALVVGIGAFGFAFSYEIEALYFLLVTVALSIALCRDFMPMLVGASVTGMVPLRFQGEAVETFLPLIPGGVILGAAFLFHLIAFKPDFKFGTFFKPTLAVAVAMTLGGLFANPLRDNFTLPALYYVFFLGFGMLGIYVLLEAYLPRKEDLAPYAAKMMVGVGVMGLVLFLSGIHEHLEVFMEEGPGRYFQWRNNMTNFLLLSMPFSFYMAVTRDNSIPYFVLGVLQYAALVLSHSRGGIIFGTAVFPFLLAFTLILSGEKRWRLIMTFALLLLALFFTFEALEIDSRTVLARTVERASDIDSEEGRAVRYREAMEKFREAPLFGQGLADEGEHGEPGGPMTIHWYYSTLFQTLASLGLAGAAAYLYQAFVRVRTLLRFPGYFHAFLLIAVGGFAAYSMVNVGYYAPLPYMAMVLHLFMVLDRHNDRLQADEALRREATY